MEKLNKILNDDYKSKNWFSKNYFYAGSVSIVLICILIFNFLGAGAWHSLNYENMSRLGFGKILIWFLNSFGHVNWQHVLLNMLCFFVCGLYFERKIGSIKLFLLILVLAFFTSITSAAQLGSMGTGFSAVNYGLYFYIIVDYLFSFQKERKIKQNVIFGAILIALIYLAMCFNGGTSSFGFEWYPYDLITNYYHYLGALAGFILGLTIQIVKLKDKNEDIPDKIQSTESH